MSCRLADGKRGETALFNHCVQLSCGLVVPKTFWFVGPDNVMYDGRLFADGTEESAEDFKGTISKAPPTEDGRVWEPAKKAELVAFNASFPYVRDEVDVLAVGETFGDGDEDYRTFALLNGGSKPQPRLRWWLTKPLGRRCMALGVVRDTGPDDHIPF